MLGVDAFSEVEPAQSIDHAFLCNSGVRLETLSGDHEKVRGPDDEQEHRSCEVAEAGPEIHPYDASGGVVDVDVACHEGSKAAKHSQAHDGDLHAQLQTLVQCTPFLSRIAC